MTVFGRDSLLTSWMLLPLDARVALGTLQVLADRQGVRSEPSTEEEPGRILHEIRSGLTVSGVPGGDSVYYGTADATPLFVMLVGELRRWGIPLAELEPLLPHVDRALEWVDSHGDRDGDGFVEYERATPHGLVNQGWKDSFDGITFPSGALPHAPIALAEVQGYVYARAARPRRAGRGLRRPRAGPASSLHRAAELEAGVQRPVLAPAPRPLRPGARRRQATRRVPGLEHGPLPVDRHRRRRARARGRRCPDEPRDVQRVRGAHPRVVDGGLQPDELPQRLDLAARQRPGRGRVAALRVRRGGPASRPRHPRRGRSARRTASRAVLRLRPRAVPGAGPLPHGVRSPGVGCGDAPVPAPGAPRPGARRPRRCPHHRPGRTRRRCCRSRSTSCTSAARRSTCS